LVLARIPADEISRIASLGTIATPEQIEEHYHRVNPENSAWAREEMARRLAARRVSTAYVMLPDDWNDEE
jgi:hypothetical protein